MSDLTRTMFANATWRTIGDLGSKAASVVLYVVIARKLGDAQFGIFTFALAYTALVTTLGGFGQDLVLAREVARDRSVLRDYFTNTLALKITLALPALAIADGVLWLRGGNHESAIVVALLGVGVVLDLLMNTSFATYQAYERLRYLATTLIFERFATAIAASIALVLGAGVVTVAGIYLASAAVAFALSLFFVHRRIEPLSWRLDVRRWRPLMFAALPVGLFTVFGVTLFRVDTAMLAGYKPAHVVGNYGAAYRLFETTLFLCWAVGAAVYPVLSRLTRHTDPPIGSIWERGIKGVVTLTLPLAVAAALLARPLIELLYGHGFPQAPEALQLLAPTIALYPVAYICGTLLLAQDRSRVLSISYGVIALQNILGNLYLIPRYSLNGAALGTTISQLLLTSWLLVYAVRTTGPIRWKRMLVGPVAASAVAALAMLPLREHVAAFLVGALVYVVVLVVFEHSFFPEDARATLALLRRAPG
jgi:O-antigen/teichoic acid export membrane protein